MSTCDRNCGHAVGTPVAVTVPIEVVIGCGGFNRSTPIGGWAYGMPLKESMLSNVDPTTVPFVIVTDGETPRSTRGRPIAETTKKSTEKRDMFTERRLATELTRNTRK